MPIEIQGLSPLLQVFDMPTSIRFYRDVLGFTVSGTSPALSDNPDDVGWAMLQLSNATLMLNTAFESEHRPEAPERVRVNHHDDTCIYFGCPDVDGAYEHLRAKGLEPAEPKVAYYGMKQLYLKDPDGFGLCFQWKA